MKAVLIASSIFLVALILSSIASAQTCAPAPPIILFSDGSSSKSVFFGPGGGSNSSVKVALPANFNATAARVNITGIPLIFTGEKKMDVVVVNDISGSMDDNCGPDGIAQPGETPCKINDMKNATLMFAGAVLAGPDNRIGLSSYNTRAIRSLQLTNNMAAIAAEIGAYGASGTTCISCGIINGTDIVRVGTNPIKAILLMTDGNANKCIPGVPCTEIVAKTEAIQKAADAWSLYGISIYAVAFGLDADSSVMEQIANVSHGKFYVASETNITEVYLEIYKSLSDSYITNPALDIGANGIQEWSHPGIFNSTEMASGWHNEINRLLNGCNCTGCFKNLSAGTCVITLNLASSASGKMVADNLSIEGCLSQQLFCGDGYLGPKEQCELPSTHNNNYCSQSTSGCSGHLYGARDSYGECNASCGCMADAFSYSCVKGLCGAECSSQSDCPPYLSDSTCYFGRGCLGTCLCGPAQQQFCPAPGTLNGSTCYFGSRQCTDSGCSIQSCTLEQLEMCDPIQGCIGLPCNPVPPITLFSGGQPSVLEVFGGGGGDNHTARVTLPANFNATAARVSLTGLPTMFMDENRLDVVVVNDISGSMDDNCPGGTADPGETPCKINDMKNATLMFAGAVLAGPDNRIGLSSYNTRAIRSLQLTNNMAAIAAEIGTYGASGLTCISCGIINGTDTVRVGSNPIKAILLMSDGNANQCYPGVGCTQVLAKQEAIQKAADAWSLYGIKIFAVAFGSDADTATMQQIANVSQGKFFVASETNITEVYFEIAAEITKSFITNASLDIGADGIVDWSRIGIFNTTAVVSGWHSPVLMGLLNGCNCTGCSKNATTGACTIELKLHSDSSGKILADNLSIEGCVYGAPSARCSSCMDCGGGADCRDYGEWSPFICSWPGICSESAECFRSRSVTDYICNNPGTQDSSCSYAQSQEQEGEYQARDTDGTPCDDGLPDTYNDQCVGGICVGSPFDCNCTDIYRRLMVLESKYVALQNQTQSNTDRIGILESIMAALSDSVSLLMDAVFP